MSITKSRSIILGSLLLALTMTCQLAAFADDGGGGGPVGGDPIPGDPGSCPSLNCHPGDNACNYEQVGCTTCTNVGSNNIGQCGGK